MIKTLILTGQGINSHKETALAFEMAGSEIEFISIEQFLYLNNLDTYDILAFPGGFSFGDEIKSGKLLAELIRINQLENIQKFNNLHKPIIGICNGFQILVQLGLFEVGKRTLTLSQNNHGKFINSWTGLKVADNNSFWLRGLDQQMEMPIRHKEGRLVFDHITDFKPAFYYNRDVNGSKHLIAGITNSAGNILGLMPHPEAGLFNQLKLDSTATRSNQQLFINAVTHAQRIKDETSFNQRIRQNQTSPIREVPTL